MPNQRLLRLAAVCVIGLSHGAFGQVRPEAEKAAVAGDWEALVQLLGTEPTTITSPPERVLSGHACLATNRCNAAFALFSSVNDADLQMWSDWTTGMAKAHPLHVAPQYFRGDALGRAGDWKEATAAFDRALAIDERSVLALNARGVCRAALREWDAAIGDFATSAAIKPEFADAHASLGTLFIHKGDGAPGALLSFERAIKQCDHSVVALNGRACANIALGNLEAAEKDLLATEAENTSAPVVAPGKQSGDHPQPRVPALTAAIAINRAELARTETGAMAQVLAEYAEISAGMTSEMISQRLSTMPAERQAELAAVMPSAVRWNKMSDFAGSWMRPLTPDVEVGVRRDFGIRPTEQKLSIYGNVKFTAIRDQFEVTKTNLASQQIVCNMLATRGVQPARLGPIDQLRVRVQNRDLLSPRAGGVSTKAIGAARLDTGQWNLVSFYTLLYPVQPVPGSPTENGTTPPPAGK